MASIKSFEDLKCWQEARSYCNTVYSILINNKEINDYALKNQINSASGSIMDNIAEGFGRDGNKEFRQFLTFAKGSCTETKSQLVRALDRNYISQLQFDELCSQNVAIQKMITGLIKYMNNSPYKGTKFMENEVSYEISKSELISFKHELRT